MTWKGAGGLPFQKEPRGPKHNRKAWEEPTKTSDGHRHGGQVFLPLIGAPFALVNDRRHLRGLYAWENRWLHVTVAREISMASVSSAARKLSVLEIG